MFGGVRLGSIGHGCCPADGRPVLMAQRNTAIAALAVASLVLVWKLSPPPATESTGKPRGGFNKKLLWLAAVVLFMISMANTLGFAFPLRGAADSVYIEFTRVFYGVGLVIAGFISDKNRRWGAICCLAALAFPFAALALGANVAGETAMWMLAYLFLGLVGLPHTRFLRYLRQIWLTRLRRIRSAGRASGRGSGYARRGPVYRHAARYSLRRGVRARHHALFSSISKAVHHCDDSRGSGSAPLGRICEPFWTLSQRAGNF